MNFRNFFTKDVKRLFVFCIFINVSLYLFILAFNDRVGLNRFNYFYNSHHYIQDTRLRGQDFSLTNSIAQYDAQWYLKIAKKGYPDVIKKEVNPMNRSLMGGMSYAFFPLYPTTLRFLNIPVNNIELTAFLFSNFMLVVNVMCLIYVIGKTISEKIAIKTTTLLFLFPFSIFYRSYFTEPIFLFLLLWYSYFLIKKKMLLSSVFFGLLNITRGSAVLLYIPNLYFLLKEYRAKTLSLRGLIISLILSVFPLGLWSLFNYYNTNDFFYFMKIRAVWIGEINIFDRIIENLRIISSPNLQQFHYFHSSQVDISIIIIVFVILAASYKILNRRFWIVSLCLFLSPLLFNDTISYSRMQIVSFPLFIYLATILKGKWFAFLAGAFAVGLFIVSLYFVNWHWVG